MSEKEEDDFCPHPTYAPPSQQQPARRRHAISESHHVAQLHLRERGEEEEELELAVAASSTTSDTSSPYKPAACGAEDEQKVRPLQRRATVVGEDRYRGASHSAPRGNAAAAHVSSDVEAMHGDGGGASLQRPVSIIVASWNTEYTQFGPEDFDPVSLPSSAPELKLLPHSDRHAASSPVGTANASSPSYAQPIHGTKSVRALRPLLDRKTPLATFRARATPIEDDSPCSSNSNGIPVAGDVTFASVAPYLETGRTIVGSGRRGTRPRQVIPLEPRGTAAPLIPVDPLSEWLDPGADVYAVSLQEAQSPSKVFYAIERYLNRVHPTREFILFRDKENDIRGRGDGAYLKSKCTTLGVFVAKDVMTHVQVRLFTHVEISSIPGGVGSKGAICAVLTIAGHATCFIGCHLPARSPLDRVTARRYIKRRLCQLFGKPGTSPHLATAFHHLVWMGDFNCRIQEVNSARAVELLAANRIADLVAYDELQYGPYAEDLASDRFVEPPLTFLPTYKKLPGRPPLWIAQGTGDKEGGRRWPLLEYATAHRQRWYKGGRMKESVPSWCDRILIWSRPEVATRLRVRPDSYRAVQPRCPDSVLLCADHNPICSHLELYPSPTMCFPTYSAATRTPFEIRMLREHDRRRHDQWVQRRSDDDRKRRNSVTVALPIVLRSR